MATGRDADDGWQRYVGWITALWEGRVAAVLGEWETLAVEFEVPWAEALPDQDLRRPIQPAVTYLSNNIARVDYPRYRRLGLPVTSTLMESLVKEFSQHVKGEDDRSSTFFAVRPGCRYRRRSTLEATQAVPATAG